jgi:uncharacterized ion transporter superfamily protein YfcC
MQNRVLSFLSIFAMLISLAVIVVLLTWLVTAHIHNAPNAVVNNGLGQISIPKPNFVRLGVKIRHQFNQLCSIGTGNNQVAVSGF